MYLHNIEGLGYILLTFVKRFKVVPQPIILRTDRTFRRGSYAC